MKTIEIGSYIKKHNKERDLTKRELTEKQELIKSGLYFFGMCI